ncbi:GGDEF domain-containing protein [Marilutibacter alkalisoli]|uniref:diguanylate cyclase n=1 Tax=Marilutibacter alkalisoli TaxID=2591633 RepID=A0A514BS75_9GAMM|nr:GGDEF domain-containing protein [Lysobacter alkalisoli]QDH70243.1 GGDEF domain-containing protein [Lysobacter alkalisoli]
MGWKFAWRNRTPLDGSELQRFRKFAFAKTRPGLTLLTFSMPLLFAVGWARDLAVLGPSARWTLLIRLSLVIALLIVAWLMRSAGSGRRIEVFGILYAFVFGIAIATTSAIEPQRLSLTHVVVMLLIIILLPFAQTRFSAAGVIVAIALPMFGLLWLLDASPGLWVAYLLFFVAGCVVGLTQRAAQMAAAAEIFVHRQRLLERLHHDSLTGTINRDGWQAHAQRMHRAHMHSGDPLSVVFFDLDHFKAVNDEHGHASGDALLQEVSRVMRASLRKHDLLARIGGEEFVALLPDLDAEAAIRVAERIRKAVAAIESPQSVTISAGVTQARPGEELKTVTDRADSALLAAKRRGRDRVERA